MSASIGDLIAFQARIRPDAPAVFCPQGIFRYRELLGHVDAMVVELERYALTDIEPVVLIFARTYVHLLLILALDRLNIPSISLLTPSSKLPWKPKATVSVFSNMKPELDFPHNWIKLPEKWSSREVDSGVRRGPGPADTTVRIILSSGTTGSPKAVCVRREALAARISEHIRDLGLAYDSRVMPLHQMSGGPGYWTCLATLAAGGMLILLKELGGCIRHADILSATHLSCSPYILGRWVERWKGRGPLNSIRVLETAGSYLPDQLAWKAHNMVSPNVYSLYGATEVGRIAFTKVTSTSRIEGAVGFVSPWCSVEIVDDTGAPLKCGEEGHVRVRTTGIVESYYRSPELTAKNIRDGWFYPGDIGTLGVDGLLKISSRADEVINLGGVKVNLQEAEEKIRRVLGVKDIAVFGVTAESQLIRLWGAVVRSDELVEDTLTSELRAMNISRVFYVEDLPYNENGKVQKEKLKKIALGIIAKEKKVDR